MGGSVYELMYGWMMVKPILRIVFTQKSTVDGWMDDWMDGKSHFKDSLQHSNSLVGGSMDKWVDG